MSKSAVVIAYEWSASSPLAKMRKCGQCPWCAELEIKGHDPDCAFMQPEIDLEKIKEDVREAAWNALREGEFMSHLTPKEREAFEQETHCDPLPGQFGAHSDFPDDFDPPST